MLRSSNRPRVVFAAALLSLSAVACKAPAETPTAAPATGASATSPASETSKAVALPNAPESAAEPASFVVRVLPAEAKAGTETTAVVEVMPNPGFKMNVDFPARLRITEPGDANPAKAELTKDDAELSEKALKFKVAYTANKAGKATLAGLADFSVCNETACRLIRGEKVAWSVDVQE